MAIRTMADGNVAIYILSTAPAAPDGVPTITELAAGINASCEVAKSGSYLRPTGSDTVNDAAFCESGNSVTYGASNFEGQLVPYLWFDPATGKYAAADNEVLEALDTKGSQPYVYFVEGVKKGADAVGGERIYGGHWTTDDPQPGQPGEYLRRTVPLGYIGGWIDTNLDAA